MLIPQTICKGLSEVKGITINNTSANYNENNAIGVNSGYINKELLVKYNGLTPDDLLSCTGLFANENIPTNIDKDHIVILPKTVNVYSVDGTLIRSNVNAAEITKQLPSGIYIINNKKVMIK